jgi:hypothetical protein
MVSKLKLNKAANSGKREKWDKGTRLKRFSLTKSGN